MSIQEWIWCETLTHSCIYWELFSSMWCQFTTSEILSIHNLKKKNQNIALWKPTVSTTSYNIKWYSNTNARLKKMCKNLTDIAVIVDKKAALSVLQFVSIKLHKGSLKKDMVYYYTIKIITR